MPQIFSNNARLTVFIKVQIQLAQDFSTKIREEKQTPYFQISMQMTKSIDISLSVTSHPLKLYDHHQSNLTAVAPCERYLDVSCSMQGEVIASITSGNRSHFLSRTCSHLRNPILCFYLYYVIHRTQSRFKWVGSLVMSGLFHRSMI